MAPKFEAEVHQVDQFTFVKLSGIVDEDNELAPLARRIHGQMVAIDLSAIQDINNCGVRDWVKWREELQSKGMEVVLLECSSAIVLKLNSVSNFNSGGYIKSFYVPYYCQACEMEKAMLVEMDELRGEGPVKPPTCRCDECDSIMAFDDLEESYFGFIKVARQAVLDDTTRHLLEQIAPLSGDRKILSGSAWRGSSFAGIAPTSSISDFQTEGGSASLPSVNSLRMLRDKTGVRTVRQRDTNEESSRARLAGRGLLWTGGGVLLVAGVASALYLILR